jgi:hypothetical protein
VYEKDFGNKTPSAAQAMTTFNPDRSWQKVESKYVEVAGKKGGD